MKSIYNLKYILKTSITYSYIRSKKYQNRRKNIKKDVLSLSRIKNILINELHIKESDNLLIHCGFGFLNANFTPEELIELIKEIIGPNGHIMMPFYPPGLSANWVLSNRLFDPKTIHCSTGLLAQTFATQCDVTFSCHPSKSVCILGKNSKELTDNHNLTEYPYDKKSPYYKFAMLENSKSIGLGVNNCTMFHCVEDIYESQKDYLYSPDKKEAAILFDGEIISTNIFYHHGKVQLERSDQFIDRHFPEVCTRVKLNETIFYSIDNKHLLQHGSEEFQLGHNRICQ